MRYQFTARMNDPDAARPDNPIHSNQTAKAHGFRGALVGGIHVYGWTSGAFIKLLGDEWLDSGWVDVAFRKPTYDGDIMTVNEAGGRFTVTNASAVVCLEGQVGVGAAPFFAELAESRWSATEPPLTVLPDLSIANAPVGAPLRTQGITLTRADHEAFLNETMREENPLFMGPSARCHPAWIAGRPIDLLHHSFQYGPAIHTRSQIQHLAPAEVGQAFTMAGRCIQAYEKNGHHYIVNDTSIYGDARVELVRLRHTAIFRLRTSA